MGTNDSTGTVNPCEAQCLLVSVCTHYLHCSVEAELDEIQSGIFGKYLGRLATIPAIRKRMAQTIRNQRFNRNRRRIDKEE